MLLVTACGPGEKKSKTGGKENENVAFPVETANDAAPVKDAFLKVAIVKDSPLVGLLNDALYSDGYDGVLIDNFLGAGIFETDENFEVTDGGIATLTVDAPNKKVTIKIKDGMKWSDGQPVVADDVIYTYEIIGNKDYTGIRYTDDNEKIIGMKEYHEGKASSISGIKKVDNSTVEISFSEIGQGVYTIGNGLIGYALPKHYLKDIPIKDLETSDKVRQKIVTTGPYTIEKTVHGESLELKANPYFYKGKPLAGETVIATADTVVVKDIESAEDHREIQGFSSKTDKDGKVNFLPLIEGLWKVKVVHKTAFSDPKVCQHSASYATLVLPVGEKRAQYTPHEHHH